MSPPARPRLDYAHPALLERVAMLLRAGTDAAEVKQLTGLGPAGLALVMCEIEARDRRSQNVVPLRPPGGGT